MRKRALMLLPLLIHAGAGHAQLLEAERDMSVRVPPPAPLGGYVPSLFTRGREVAVADRSFPAFSAQGISVGNFDFFPGVTVGAIFSSNPLANDDRKRATGGFLVRPELTVRTSAGPYSLAVRGVGDFRRYVNQTSENSEEGLVSADGEIMVGPLGRIFAGASYGSLIEPRYASDSPTNGAKPLQYRALLGNIGGSFELGRFRIVGRADASQYRFSDLPLTDGTRLDTKDRNRERYQGALRLEYALSPAISIYTSGTVNAINYQRGFGVDQVDRDSTGWGAFLGTSFDLTRLIRGDVRVGYIEQNFRTPGVPKVSGLGALGKVEYFPTELTTVTLSGESTVQDTGVPGTTGVLHRGGSVRVDHEFRRYLIGSIEGGYFRDSYRGSIRRDNLPFARASATYVSRNHWNARLGYEYRNRGCSCSGLVEPFTDHRVMATLTFQR